MLDAEYKLHCPRQTQTLSTKTGTELGCDVENKQAGAFTDEVNL
jgi:hypothetical protein